MKSTMRLDADAVAQIQRLVGKKKDRCTLTVLSGRNAGTVYAVAGAPVLLGRGDNCDIRIQDDGVSGSHASLTRQGNAFLLVDQGSTNGTWVNAERLHHPRQVEDGDRIQLGVETVLRADLHTMVEQEAAERLYDAGVRDPLTKAHNRRYLDDRADSEHAFALRHGTPLSVLMIDVDYFKRVNDTHGHQAGDEVLKNVSATLQYTVRKEDTLARYGGEEFLILVRGVPHEGATALGERVRSSLERLVIPWEGQQLRVTASVGVATMSPAQVYETPATLIAAADHCLYQAKETGRNRVCAA